MRLNDPTLALSSSSVEDSRPVARGVGGIRIGFVETLGGAGVALVLLGVFVLRR
jgi:hypothetical protein